MDNDKNVVVSGIIFYTGSGILIPVVQKFQVLLCFSLPLKLLRLCSAADANGLIVLVSDPLDGCGSAKKREVLLEACEGNQHLANASMVIIPELEAPRIRCHFKGITL